jgi:aryl-alcohol dehydrogenase-like predicted oxidoreductase
MVNERVTELAKKKGVSMPQIAFDWSLANDFVTASVVGTTNLDSLKELIGAIY